MSLRCWLDKYFRWGFHQLERGIIYLRKSVKNVALSTALIFSFVQWISPTLTSVQWCPLSYTAQSICSGMVDLISEATRGQKAPGVLVYALQPWQGALVSVYHLWGGNCVSFMLPRQRAWHKQPQTCSLTLLHCRNAWIKESVVMAKGIGKVRGGKKEGGGEGRRGKWGLKVWLFPSNTDQWSENLLASHHKDYGGTWDVRLGTRGRRQTLKIQTPAGHLTLRDTEALGLSRLDKQLFS